MVSQDREILLVARAPAASLWFSDLYCFAKEWKKLCRFLLGN